MQLQLYIPCIIHMSASMVLYVYAPSSVVYVRLYYIRDADIVIMYNISVHMHAGAQTKLHLHHTASYIQSI